MGHQSTLCFALLVLACSSGSELPAGSNPEPAAVTSTGGATALETTESTLATSETGGAPQGATGGAMGIAGEVATGGSSSAPSATGGAATGGARATGGSANTGGSSPAATTSTTVSCIPKDFQQTTTLFGYCREVTASGSVTYKMQMGAVFGLDVEDINPTNNTTITTSYQCGVSVPLGGPPSYSGPPPSCPSYTVEQTTNVILRVYRCPRCFG